MPVASFMASLRGTGNVTRDIRSRAIFREIMAGRIHDDAEPCRWRTLTKLPSGATPRIWPHCRCSSSTIMLHSSGATDPLFCGSGDAWGLQLSPILYAVGEVAGGTALNQSAKMPWNAMCR